MYPSPRAVLLAAIASIGAATIVSAQPTPHPAGGPPAGAAGHAGMAGAMDMDAMHCMGLSEARLAVLKAELNINDRQLRAWNAFASAQSTPPHAMSDGMRMGMGMSPAGAGHQGPDSAMMGSMTLPQRLAQHEMMMKWHLEALRRVRGSVTRLYAVLAPAQKAKADRLLCGGMMAMPMRH